MTLHNTLLINCKISHRVLRTTGSHQGSLTEQLGELGPEYFQVLGISFKVDLLREAFNHVTQCVLDFASFDILIGTK